MGSVPVGETGLQCMRIEKDNGKLVSFGSKDGSTTLYEISDSLSQAQANEKQTIMSMLERESNREKNLAAIEKEKKVKLKEMEAKATAAAEAKDGGDSNESDNRIAEIEKEFYEMIGQARGEGTSEGPKGGA